MERLAGRLADGLVQKGIVIQTDRDFYRFAIESLLVYALNLGTLFLAAILSGKVPECIFFLTVFYPLRTSCGGIHMKTWYSCYVVSCVLLESILLLSGIVHISYLLLLCGFTACSVCIWTMAPCENPRHSCNRAEKMRAKSKARLCSILLCIMTAVLKLLHMEQWATLGFCADGLCAILLLAGHIENRKNTKNK